MLQKGKPLARGALTRFDGPGPQGAGRGMSGNLMSPSYTVRRRNRYRYYVSSALLRGRKQGAGSIARVGADDVERIVVAALRRERCEPAIDTFGVWNSETRKLVRESIDRVDLCAGGIHLTLKTRQAGTLSKAIEAEVRAEVEQLRSLDKDALRVRWSKMFGKPFSARSHAARRDRLSTMQLKR
jgi:hypothetical protein